VIGRAGASETWTGCDHNWDRSILILETFLWAVNDTFPKIRPVQFSQAETVVAAFFGI
jgi:hypothetical protein